MAARFRPSGQVPTLSNTDKALDAQKTTKEKHKTTKNKNKQQKQKSNLKYSRISQYANSCSNRPFSLLLHILPGTCCGRLGQFQLRRTAFARVSHARLALLLPLQLLAENVAQLKANAMRLRDETL